MDHQAFLTQSPIQLQLLEKIFHVEGHHEVVISREMRFGKKTQRHLEPLVLKITTEVAAMVIEAIGEVLEEDTTTIITIEEA